MLSNARVFGVFWSVLVLHVRRVQSVCTFSPHPGSVFSVDEDALPFTPIALGSTFTGDAYPLCEARLASASPGPMGIFYVKPDSGEVFTSTDPSDLNYEQATQHTLVVEIREPGDRDTKSSVSITVRVNDRNDDPAFAALPNLANTVYVDEDVGTGTSVFTVVVNDEDNDVITYAILSQIPAGTPKFSIGPTGVVSTVGSLQADDPGAVTSYTLLIRASDGQVPITANLNINVRPVFDEPPKFLKTLYVGEINEDVVFGTGVTWPVSTPNGPVDELSDRDAGDSSTFTLSGAGASKFSVDASGIIATMADFDLDGGASDTYSFKLIATDQGGVTGTTSVSVTVLPVNEYPPVFDPVVYNEVIFENGGAGATVVELSCTDQDIGDTLTLEIITGDDLAPANKFDTSGTSLITNGVLDYEAVTSDIYILTVKATDSGGKTSTAQVSVQVKGINEFTPAFPGAPFAVPVPEDQAIGAPFFTLPVVDADKGADGLLFHEIISSSPASGLSKFTIHATSGTIGLKSKLDYETQRTYTLRCKVSDSGTPQRSGTVDVVVNVQDVNDNPPTIGPIDPVVVREDATAGTVLVDFDVIDLDSSDVTSFHFNISSGDTTLPVGTVGLSQFQFDVPNRQLELRDPIQIDPLDPVTYPDNYALVVEIADAPGGQTATATVYVTIEPVNEYDPVFQPLPPSITITEGAAYGANVVVINATDGDIGSQGEVEYSIIDGDTFDNFAIDAAGNITVKNEVDYEETGSPVLLTLLAEDKGVSPKRSATTTVTVTVNDVTGDAPIVCTSESIVVQLVENVATAGALIEDIDCTDPDGLPLVYSFTPTDPTEFSIDSTSGEVTLDVDLDYDDPAVARVYPLEVSVTDGGTDTTYVTLTVNLLPFNDFTPTIADIAKTYPEYQAVDTVIVDASAVGAVDGDEPPHGIVSYSKISAVPISGMTKFALDPNTGEIILTSPLDREVEDNYQLVLKVTDGGGQTATATLSVTVTDINDNTPQCLATAFNVEALENTFPLTVVSNVGGSDELQCTDPDASLNGDLTYTLTEIDPVASVFQWSAGTGVVLNSGLDYEINANHQYKLELKVADGGAPPKSVDIDITVTVLPQDEGPPVLPVAPACDVSIPETDVIDQLVVSCAATDLDSPDSPDGLIVYEITGGNTDDLFYIDENGDIRVKNAIDYESLGTTVFNLALSAKDATSADLSTATITITDDNDFVPVCTDMSFVVIIDEETTADNVFTLTCTDDDSADATLNYAFDNSYSGPFSVTTAGVVKLDTEIDFEADPTSYKLKVLVTDSATQPHQIAVEGTVVIQPVNDHAPAFQPNNAYSFAVDENVTRLSPVATVLATDADSPLTEHGQVTYSIAASCACPQFDVDQNGDVILVGSLDYETATSHTITVEALDSDTTVAATVTLTVNNVNDNPPVFSPSIYSATVSENDPPGLTVITLTVNDLDVATPNTDMEFLITGGNPLPQFDIDDSGNIKTLVQLEYDDPATQIFRLQVEVRDELGAVGYKSATANVTIFVSPYNDHAPVFTGPGSAPYTQSIREDASIGTSVYQMTASDADLGLDGRFFFALTPGTHFTIDELTGTIRVKARLDRETLDEHTVSVTVTDRGTPPLPSSPVDVVFTVTDVNDVVPFCTVNYAAVSADEGVPSAILVDVGAMCSDADDGPNAQLFYSITSVDGSPTSPLFSVTAAGVLSLIAPLDYETQENHIVTLQVSDGGTPSLATEVVVIVNVAAMNEFDPEIDLPDTHAIDILDSTQVNDIIFAISASDADKGERVFLSFLPTSSKFRIDHQTGEIYLISKVNAGDSFSLIVVAEDTGTNPGTKTDSVTLNVNVVSGTNNPPEFGQNLYFGSVNENAAVPFAVVPLTVSDVDGDNVAVSITAGNAGGVFGVNAANEIFVADNTNLDAETQSTYTLSLKAADDGVPPLSATATAYIEVNFSNEHAPVFSPASYTDSVSESALSGTTVLRVSATDADDGQGGILTFSILSGSDGKFGIDSVTGDIVVVDFLDAETKAVYTLQVQVADNTATDVATATINIIDENDENPICSPDFYSWRCAENTPVGTVLGQLSCSDGGGGSQLSYYIVDGNDFNTFGIPDATQPDVVVRTSPNYEQRQSFQLLVRVADDGLPPVSATATVVVDILGVNEYTPDFGASSIAADASEALNVGATIIALSATDNDEGIDGEVGYVVTSGNEDDKFHLSEYSGEITVLKKLDWETTKTYKLVLEARDRGTPGRTGTATLNIQVTDANDNVPYCDPVAYMGTVAEDSYIGTPVITPNCMDGDEGSDFVYSIVSGNEDGRLSIDPLLGTVYTSNVLDAESNDTYVLTIHVSDGLSFGTAVITVSVQGVNEYPPIFSPPVYVTSVPEDAAPDTLVETVTTTDADALNDGLVMYTITGGNVDDVFKVNSSSGEIFVKRALDRETIDVYELEVTATDQAAPGQEKTALATVRVTVTDVNDQTPYFEPFLFAGYVREDAAIGSVIMPLTVIDNDRGSPNTDHVVTIRTGDDDGLFGVSGDNIIVIKQLDFETERTHHLLIEVTDLGVPPLSSTGTVAITVKPVNEEPPLFDTPTGGYVREIPEDILPGTSVLTVEATETIETPDHVHGRIRYEVLGGDGVGKFAIDRFSGLITTVDVFDRETKDEYALVVIAKDSLPSFGDELNDTTTVVITISDVNDNVPVFVPALQSITVLEPVTKGSLLLRLSVTDMDIGTNGEVTVFDIVSGDTGGDFMMDGIVLRNDRTLAWHRTQFYRLRVRATDNGKPNRSGYAVVTVVVKPVNEFPPVLQVADNTISVPEDIRVGSVIYDVDVAADDKDYGLHGELSFYIVDGNGGGTFHIDKDTGQLSVAGYLDREFQEIYSLNITVYDRAENDTLVKSDSMILTITLEDVNDNDPICENPRQVIYLEENVQLGEELTTFSASDPDSGDNALLAYSIVAGIPAVNYLQLDADGSIYPKQQPDQEIDESSLDRELYDIYSIVIQVTDNGVPQRTALCTVEVHLIDVNDNAPIITPAYAIIPIEENGPAFEELLVFTATDADEGLNGEVFFTIIGGNDEGHFNIDVNSGRLITVVSLDREEISSYDLVIRVSDKGDPALVAEASITVEVEDLNDEGPRCKEPFNRQYTTNVREDMTVGMTAMVILSNDRDDYRKRHAERTYRIISGSDGMWSIDPEIGNIYLIGSLNMAIRRAYSFVIRIEDDGDQTMYDECTANINVVEALQGVPVTSAAVVIRIPENTPDGTFIGQVSCDDFDPDVCQGQGLQFSVIAGEYAPHFYMEPITGSLTVSTDNLDYEVYPQYNLLVAITSENGFYAHGVIVVMLLDQNDHAPAFLDSSPYTSSVREDSPLGTTVLHVSAVDEDAGEDSVLTYSISSALADNGPIANKYFMMDPDTGVITVLEELDSELYREIELSVLAVDAGSPPLTASTTATIQIVDVNDNSPVFSPSFYSGEMSYLNLLGEPIIQIRAIDADQTSIIRYSIEDTSTTFEANPTTGEVSLATGARPTVYTRYSFTATAIDDGNPPLTSSPANCRIDTFDPYLNLVGIHVSGRTKQEILDNKEEFLAPLSSIISADYPTGRIGISHITVVGDIVTSSARRLLQSSSVVVWIYGVADDTADTESGLENTKNFISQQYLYTTFASDEKGTPSPELSALSEYPAVFVEKYAATVQSFWTTDAGIATIAILSLLGLLALIGLCSLCYCCFCVPQTGTCAGCAGAGRALFTGVGAADFGGSATCCACLKCCGGCWPKCALAIKNCCEGLCKSKPRPPTPQKEEKVRGKRHGWGEHVYREYHRDELPVKAHGVPDHGPADKPRTPAGRVRPSESRDEIGRIKRQHEADKALFQRVQGEEKAKAEQDLQSKLAERTTRRYGNPPGK